MLGLTPVMVMATLPAFSLGSGKFATPFLRMHAENFNAWAMKALAWTGVGAVGANDLQAFCAAWNCAEFGFTPLPPGPSLKRKSPFAFRPGSWGHRFFACTGRTARPFGMSSHPPGSG